MSSGYGLSGGVGRCFPFWQEVLACYVLNVDNDAKTGKKVCHPALEDYYECLHNKKEMARAQAIKMAMYEKERKGDPAFVPTRDQLKSLGLIRKE